VSVTWTSLARNDLLEIVDYVAAENPAAALRLASAVGNGVVRLARYPRLGRQGRVAQTGELVIVGTPYVVVYRQQKREVEILRVLHGARQWPEPS
jgi:toxin ParE1/3/4